MNTANLLDADLIRNAFAAGERTAKGYKVGDRFLGATPEADKQGFGSDALARSAFISAYINNLASPVITTEDCILLRYGKAA